MSAPALRVLSLGGGVQSSTLLLMADRGEFGVRPDLAIFADTQWEPKAVYAWLDQLTTMVSIPIRRVSRGNIRDNFVRASGKRFVSPPLHVKKADGTPAMIRRQCTSEYKIEPIQSAVRAECASRGIIGRRAGLVEQWIGISLDEYYRMKPSRLGWISHRWPLVERRMTRHDCLNWLQRGGFPVPPKSACIGCPFTDDVRWREMKRERPEEYADAIAVDRAVRGQAGKIGQYYLHRSLKPLDEVDVGNAEDRGQLDLFGNECEGMCGV